MVSSMLKQFRVDPTWLIDRILQAKPAAPNRKQQVGLAQDLIENVPMMGSLPKETVDSLLKLKQPETREQNLKTINSLIKANN